MSIPVSMKIKKARLDRKLTQTAFAALIGVTPGMISEYESGKFTPSAKTIKKLEKIGVNIRPPFFTRIKQKITESILTLLMPTRSRRSMFYFRKESRLSSFPSKDRSSEECWIRYQLVSQNIRLVDIADKANCSASLVSTVLSGKRKNESVKVAIAEILGYKSWQHLSEDAEKNIKKADN